MVDHLKRRTLKFCSGVSIAAWGTINGIAVANSKAPKETLKESLNSINNLTDQTHHKQLGIQIITGKSTPEDSVIFTNYTMNPIAVSKFLPGVITLGNQMINLNTLIKSTPLVVEPDYPLTSSRSKWQPLELDQDHSYLWCDTAAEAYDTHSTAAADIAGVINIDAVVVIGRALLTVQQRSSALT